MPATSPPPIDPPLRHTFAVIAALSFPGRVGSSAAVFSVLLDRNECASLAGEAAGAAVPPPAADDAGSDPESAGRELPPHFRRLSQLR